MTLPTSLARLVLGVAVVASLGIAIESVLRRRGDPSTWVLVGLLLLGGLVRLLGIDHEVEERYYLDEGTYYRHATEINEGDVLRGRFVYPHLLYYLYAFALWGASQLEAVVDPLAATLFSVTEAVAVDWLVMRVVAALLSVSAVAPVFLLGRWLGDRKTVGTVLGALGTLLLVFSPLFNDGSHLLISDAPSAVFATWALWATTRVIYRERARDYALAGVFAGLAAATKYPAGVVAIAIVATWLGLRWRKRRWSWGLLWAGLSSIATFVAVMPSLLFFPRHALLGDQGMLFGLRQYSGGGWIGVMPRSNFGYYLQELALSFGAATLIVATAGLAVTFVFSIRGLELVRWRLPHLLAFPVGYLLLVGSMNMVVKRNLYPALPALCVLVAAGLTAITLVVWRHPLATARLGKPILRAAVVAGLLAVLAAPVWRTALQTAAFTRPGTRVLAREWIREHVARGAFVVKESYTPDLSHAEYRVRQARFVPRLGLDFLRSPDVDLVLVSSSAFNRFFVHESFEEHHRAFRDAYQALFAEHEQLVEIAPSATRSGPWIRIYRGGPLAPVYRDRLEIPAGEIFVPDPRMRDGESPAAQIRFQLDGQWCGGKGFLRAGRYRVRVVGAEKVNGSIRVQRLDRGEILSAPIENGLAEIELPSDGKAFFRIALPLGAVVEAIRIEPLAGEDAAP